jgi:hypothetical protein
LKTCPVDQNTLRNLIETKMCGHKTSNTNKRESICYRLGSALGVIGAFVLNFKNVEVV